MSNVYKKYELMIFDLDGTILDTIEDLADSVNYALKKYGYETHTVRQIQSMVGNGMFVLMREALPEGTDEEVVQKALTDMKAYYKDHCAVKTKPYEGIVALLQELKKAGYKLAVVSNKADYAVQILCNQYFAGIFDLTVGEKENIRKKPAPDAVYATLDKLQISKEKAVYIGDSEVDIETAKNAGMQAVLVSWGFRDKEELLKNGAQTIVDTVEELKSALT